MPTRKYHNPARSNIFNECACRLPNPLDAVLHQSIGSRVLHLRGVDPRLQAKSMSRGDDCLEDLASGRLIVTIEANFRMAKALTKAENLVGHVVELALLLHWHNTQIATIRLSVRRSHRTPLSSAALSGYGSIILVTAKFIETTGSGVS